MTFWERASNYPPCLVRMLARKKGGKPMDLLDICNSTRSTTPRNAVVTLSPSQVESLSQSTSWDDIPLEVMHDYLVACGLDFCDWPSCHRMDEYIKSRPSFVHLRGGRLDGGSPEGKRLEYLSRRRKKNKLLSETQSAELMILQMRNDSNSTEWKTYWLPLMIRWRKSHGVVNKNSTLWPPLRDLLMRMNPLIK